ncbi:hypothetical protein BDY19DRAFT_918736 [Irpex rosettiformis]|uniref:Uncharacterized protein n=1 Tax=Irpex rosettiformis TaxID=378272 RepID=A0ACB8UHK0_9APHY|nr:hypothetical protein BDY19DRAFT_918736 [Irpex rosettiformis]
MATKLSFSLLSAVLIAPAVLGASLWIPGFDPQPVTVISELGVGSAGETTYLIAPGVSSGSFGDSGFFGQATLISGPKTAEIIYDQPSLSIALNEKCSINGNVADCTLSASINGEATAGPVQETVSPFEVQGNIDAGSPVSAATPTASGASNTAASTPTSKASAGSGASNGPAATGSNSSSSPSPSASAQGNGALTTVVRPFMTAFVGIVLVFTTLVAL